VAEHLRLAIDYAGFCAGLFLIRSLLVEARNTYLSIVLVHRRGSAQQIYEILELLLSRAGMPQPSNLVCREERSPDKVVSRKRPRHAKCDAPSKLLEKLHDQDG
jgi:hypothetical protein